MTDPYCVRTIKWPLSGRGLGSRDQISKFWDPPNNFWSNWAICFKFGTYIGDAPLRRANHKITPKWAWPGSRDQISKFWDALITLERIEIYALNLAQILMMDHYCVRTIKWPLSGRGLGHVTESCTQRTNCLPPSWRYIKGKWYVY